MTPQNLDAWRGEVEGTLEACLEALPQGRLADAMRYAVLGGGKRLRPLLCLAACSDSGGALEHALPSAGAIELIHCYSLVHDDLPCMDDDAERRGRPSLHKAFDEATALLAGDALQSLAFQLLAQSPGLSEQGRVCMLGELSAASGAAGMAGGQMLDLESHLPKHRQLDYLKRTQALKTGALFRAALRLGLLSAERDMHQLDAFCEYFALAFQAADDLRDRLGRRADLGKPTGSDERSGTLTWPSLLGIDQARDAFVHYRTSSLEQLRQAEFAAPELIKMTEFALDIDDLR